MTAPFWSFDPELFASTFGLVFLSELPDKTALATMVMATRRHPAAVFVGVTAAFVFQSFVAVLLGGALGLLPERWVRGGAAAMFFFFAWKLWNEGDETEEVEGLHGWRASGFRHAAGASFMVIFLAEWGDLSQLATAALAAKNGRPLTVFLGASAALASVTAVAVTVGHGMKGRFHPRTVRRAAAVLFVAVGLAVLFR